MGFSADNDPIRLDRHITAELLRYYGKMIRLFESVTDALPCSTAIAGCTINMLVD